MAELFKQDIVLHTREKTEIQQESLDMVWSGSAYSQLKKTDSNKDVIMFFLVTL